MRECVKLAEEATENPVIAVEIVDEVDPCTKHGDKDVGHRQVDDVEVGRGPHLPVAQDHHNDEGVPDEREEDDHRVDVRLQHYLVQR